MVKSATKHTTSMSAMALAATSVSSLLLRSRLVTEVLSCKKSIEKTWLGALLTRLKTHESLTWKVRNNVNKISRNGGGNGGMVEEMTINTTKNMFQAEISVYERPKLPSRPQQELLRLHR